MMSISRSYPGNIYLSGTTFMPGVSFSSSALPVFLHHHIIDKIKKSVWQPAFQPKRSPWLPPRLATGSSCKRLFLPTSTIKMIKCQWQRCQCQRCQWQRCQWYLKDINGEDVNGEDDKGEDGKLTLSMDMMSMVMVSTMVMVFPLTRWMDRVPLWPALPCCHTSPWTNPPDSWSWFMMSIMMMVTMIVTWRSCWGWTSQEANRRWNPHSFLTLTFITMKYKAISDPLWKSPPTP